MEVRRVLAPNPGLFTGQGTNTWIVDSAREVVVIDPGPAIDSHLVAIERSLEGTRAAGVLVTHTHPDHAPLANRLADRLGVPAYGFGSGPEFEPDRVLDDGDRVGFGRESLTAVHTPGHTPDHLCYLSGMALFTGDHIIGGSTVVIEDLAAYLASLQKLQTLELRHLYPGHGPEMPNPHAVIAEYIAHRLERETQILDAVGSGARTVGEIVKHVYTQVDPALHGVAAYSVAAHLRKLGDEGRVQFSGEAEWEAPVELLEEAP